MFSVIKIMQTLNFMKTNAAAPLTFRQMYDHIFEVWGEEMIQKLKDGKTDIKEFMHLMNMSDSDRNIWINRIDLFIERLREKKNR